MEVDEFLEGESLTGQQAAIVFFAFLLLIVIGAIGLILFGDVFKDLFAFVPA